MLPDAGSVCGSGQVLPECIGNMQVVFATTVIGWVVSLAGLITQPFKQRWYTKDRNNLEYVSRVLTHQTTGHENA